MIVIPKNEIIEDEKVDVVKKKKIKKTKIS